MTKDNIELSPQDLDILGKSPCVFKTNKYSKTFYSSVWYNGKNNYIHRVVMSRIAGRELLRHERVDHIDGNGLNNKRDNLRICSHRENMRNMKCLKINGTSVYKGVCFLTKQEKWEAKIMKDYKNIYIGRYETEVEAARAYNKKAIELFGEFACINKIEE